VDELERKKNIRRTTLIVAAVALAFFVGFIMMAVMRA
jgi:hypothetical protein